MRTALRLGVVVLIFAVMGWAPGAFALTITDKYIGADPSRNYNHVDVIGAESLFDIFGMEVNLIGTQLVVDIHSNYFNGHVGALHTGLGDLFISDNGWNPYSQFPGDNYVSDNSDNGETWEYVIALDVVDSKNVARLYSLKGLTDEEYAERILLSNEVKDPSWYIYRERQEVLYGGPEDAYIRTGEWGINGEFLNISINTEALGWDLSTLGFHYGMTCGNDVIEGSAAPAPEPATVFLFGAGLIAMAVVGRKKMRGGK